MENTTNEVIVMDMEVSPPRRVKVTVKIDLVVTVGGGEMRCKLQVPLRRGENMEWGIGEEVRVYLELYTSKVEGAL